MALRLLPNLPEFRVLAKSLRVSAKRKLNDGVQFWAVQNAPAQLGASEVEQASLLAEAVRQFSALERRLDSGEDVSKYLAATLPSQRPPTAPRPTMVVEKRGSLEGSKARGQKAVPKAILTPLATKLGVTEAMCKPGLDGALAGDAECYTLFRRAFEPEIGSFHQGFSGKHSIKLTTNLPDQYVTSTTVLASGQTLTVNAANLPDQYVISSTVLFNWNLAALRFLPAMTLLERAEVERLAARVCSGLSGTFEGDYFPQAGSDSSPFRRGGMSQAEAAALRSAGLLFERPADSAADWHNARGVFASSSRSFCIWANEEDHLRLRVALAGGQLVETFRQFCQLEDVVREGLKRGDHAYAQHVDSGFLTASPNKLGTDGMRVGAVLRLPKLLAWEDLPSLIARRGAEATLLDDGGCLGSAQPA